MIWWRPHIETGRRLRTPVCCDNEVCVDRLKMTIWNKKGRVKRFNSEAIRVYSQQFVIKGMLITDFASLWFVFKICNNKKYAYALVLGLNISTVLRTGIPGWLSSFTP